MDFTRMRALSSLFSMLNKNVRNALLLEGRFSFDIIGKGLVYPILWSFAGDATLAVRTNLGRFIVDTTQNIINVTDLTHFVGTDRHQTLLSNWLAEHKPFGNTKNKSFSIGKTNFACAFQYCAVHLVPEKRNSLLRCEYCQEWKL